MRTATKLEIKLARHGLFVFSSLGAFANEETGSSVNFHLRSPLHEGDGGVSRNAWIGHVGRIDHMSLFLILRNEVRRPAIVLLTRKTLTRIAYPCSRL